jgi:hypothetical protein
MTSIVSIITVFMATFMLVFGYLTYAEEDPELVEADTPAASATLSDR